MYSIKLSAEFSKKKILENKKKQLTKKVRFAILYKSLQKNEGDDEPI